MDDELHHDYDRAPWRKVPIAEVTTFKPGCTCLAPSYWAVTPDECVIFYESRRHSAPQRNTNPEVVRHLHPTLAIRLIEQAYAPREPQHG